MATERLRSGGSKAMPVILDLLHDSDHDVVRAALQILPRMGSSERLQAIPCLQELANSTEDGDLFKFTSQILLVLDSGSRKQALRLWVSRMQNLPAHQVGTLSIQPNDAEFLADCFPTLVVVLRNRDKCQFHQTTIELLTLRPTESIEIIEAVSEVLQDEDQPPQLRRFAADALLKMKGPRAVAAGSMGLKAKDVELRQWIAHAMRELGKDETSPAIPALQIALEDPDPLVRTCAAVVLAKAGHSTSLVIESLLHGLRKEEGCVLCDVLEGIAEVGPKAKAAVQILLVDLKHVSPSVRERASAALAKIDPEAAAKAGILAGSNLPNIQPGQP